MRGLIRQIWRDANPGPMNPAGPSRQPSLWQYWKEFVEWLRYSQGAWRIVGERTGEALLALLILAYLFWITGG